MGRQILASNFVENHSVVPGLLHADRQTGVMKLIGALHFVVLNAPKTLIGVPPKPQSGYVPNTANGIDLNIFN